MKTISLLFIEETILLLANCIGSNGFSFSTCSRLSGNWAKIGKQFFRDVHFYGISIEPSRSLDDVFLAVTRSTYGHSLERLPVKDLQDYEFPRLTVFDFVSIGFYTGRRTTAPDKHYTRVPFNSAFMNALKRVLGEHLCCRLQFSMDPAVKDERHVYDRFLDVFPPRFSCVTFAKSSARAAEFILRTDENRPIYSLELGGGKWIQSEKFKSFVRKFMFERDFARLQLDSVEEYGCTTTEVFEHVLSKWDSAPESFKWTLKTLQLPKGKIKKTVKKYAKKFNRDGRFARRHRLDDSILLFDVFGDNFIEPDSCGYDVLSLMWTTHHYHKVALENFDGLRIW